jgi:hypothetical protein
MPRKQPTLDAAMRTILQTEPEQTATLQRLSEENARRDLYRQAKGDGKHPQPHQFKLRTLHYPEFQFIPPNRIRYIGAAAPIS